MKPGIWFAVLALLVACGDLPQPFRGRPGGDAAQLVAPPGARVAVPPPVVLEGREAFAAQVAESLAEALRTAEVPAVAAAPQPLDWRVGVSVAERGDAVVLRYALLDPDGQEQGTAEGAPVPRRVWSNPEQVPLPDISRQAARQIATLMARAEATRKATDPAAMVDGGPPRIRVVPVGGAPGDGNAALTRRMTTFLAESGFMVSETASAANFAVQGQVVLARTGPATQRVEIQWIVSRRDGEELGRVVQINEIPAGSLDRMWGDVAYVAAQQAAGGVQRVVSNAGGFPAARDGDGAGTAMRRLEIPTVFASLPVPTYRGGAGTVAVAAAPTAPAAPAAPAAAAVQLASATPVTAVPPARPTPQLASRPTPAPAPAVQVASAIPPAPTPATAQLASRPAPAPTPAVQVAAAIPSAPAPATVQVAAATPPAAAPVTLLAAAPLPAPVPASPAAPAPSAAAPSAAAASAARPAPVATAALALIASSLAPSGRPVQRRTTPAAPAAPILASAALPAVPSFDTPLPPAPILLAAVAPRPTAAAQAAPAPRQTVPQEVAAPAAARPAPASPQRRDTAAARPGARRGAPAPAPPAALQMPPLPRFDAPLPAAPQLLARAETPARPARPPRERAAPPASAAQAAAPTARPAPAAPVALAASTPTRGARGTAGRTVPGRGRPPGVALAAAPAALPPPPSFDTPAPAPAPVAPAPIAAAPPAVLAEAPPPPRRRPPASRLPDLIFEGRRSAILPASAGPSRPAAVPLPPLPRFD